MKKFLIFLAGFVSGIVFLLIVSVIIANGNDEPTDISGLTMFEQPAEVIDSPSFEVFQVVSGGNALANAYDEGLDMHFGMVVLFLANENAHYYDDQLIEVTNNKCVRQVGTFQYDTKEGYKTVPAVMMFDK